MLNEHLGRHTSIGPIITASLISGILACSLVDDEPPVADTGDSDPGNGDCSTLKETAAAHCSPGMNFEAMVEGGGGSIILVDDPGATVGIGPNVWLVQVGAAADYVANYEFEGTTCSVGCGWCQPGESMCHQGFDEQGIPVGCMMCIAYGTPDMGTQCAAFMAACDGLDETGADDPGADETGADSDSEAMENADPEAFDCRDWEPHEAVVVDDRGTVTVDAAIVEMAAAHFGEPLAQCDGTRFRRRSDGYYEVSALAADGLLARIGLERGDMIVAVDDEPMHEADRIVAKAMDLFMGGHPASVLTLVVLRGGQSIDTLVHIR